MYNGKPNLMRGSKVVVLNQNMRGEIIVEGTAKLVAEVKDNATDIPAWQVEFGEGDIVTRYIYNDEAVEKALTEIKERENVSA